MTLRGRNWNGPLLLYQRPETPPEDPSQALKRGQHVRTGPQHRRKREADRVEREERERDAKRQGTGEALPHLRGANESVLGPIGPRVPPKR